MNAAFGRLTGLSRELVVGKTVNEVIPEPSRTIVSGKCRQAIEEQTTVFWEETSEYPTGRLTGEVTIAPVFDEKGACTHLVGSVHDITELRRSERKFYALLESAPDAMVAVDRQGKIALSNAQVESLFGYKQLELSGKSIEVLIPERFRLNYLGRHTTYFQKPRVREMGVALELYGLHKDGREFPVEVSLSPIETEAGMLVASAIRDITARRRAETALRESEARLALAQNAAQLGVWDSDLRTNVITIRGKYAELHGFSADRTTITRAEWESLIHPEDRKSVDRLRREARERTHTFDAEFRVRWTEGSTHWVHAKGSVLTDDSGQAYRATGIIWDITERKRAEAKLRESEERFRRVFEAGPLGVALGAKNGRFLKVNNALCQMTGYSEEELLQKTSVDITHANDARTDVELSEHLFRGEIPFYRLQKRYVKKTGEIIWINLSASLLRDPEGDAPQRLLMIEDVTEAKRNQEETILRQKLESVGTVASGIAHDFNNLLGAVLAQTELAQAELAEGKNPEGELKVICEIARRGSEIVRELLIYAGKESSVLNLVNVSQVIEEMLELLKISVSKHATIKTDLTQNLPSIRASAAQISRLVMNLATNASDALGERNGMIRIATQHLVVGRGSGEGHGLAEGEYVRIEVFDTGCGIPREKRARIFDPFFSTKSRGRGLGLAVVQGIVKDLGGTIDLVSELGRGTRFQIVLPCAEIVASAKPLEPAVDQNREPLSETGCSSRQSQATFVLVVEDEDALRKPMSMMLRKHGFSVIEAGDGLAALDVIRKQSGTIHFLCLDITLPGASSREVLEEARRLRPEMKVIVTSAYTEEMAGNSLQSRIEHFLRKPYGVHDLTQLFDAIANVSQTRAAKIPL